MRSRVTRLLCLFALSALATACTRTYSVLPQLDQAKIQEIDMREVLGKFSQLGFVHRSVGQDLHSLTNSLGCKIEVHLDSKGVIQQHHAVSDPALCTYKVPALLQ